MSVSPKKRLGQHFLLDKKVCNDIVSAARLSSDDYVLEIGAGDGRMTQILLAKGAYVVAVEKDARCTHILAPQPRLEWIEKDILDMSWPPSSWGKPIKVIGNIPYYLSTALLWFLVKHQEDIESITLLVQKEFAQKMLCLSGLLSLTLQIHFTPSIVRDVSRKAFFPAPRVTSSILSFTRRNPAFQHTVDFLCFAKKITQRKRQMLRSAYDRMSMEKALCAFSLPINTRLSELSFIQLFDLFCHLEQRVVPVKPAFSYVDV